MRGVQFVTDDTGKRTAVLINLAEWGEIWEDLYDIMVSESRRNESPVPWEELKVELARVRHRREVYR